MAHQPGASREGAGFGGADRGVFGGRTARGRCAADFVEWQLRRTGRQIACALGCESTGRAGFAMMATGKTCAARCFAPKIAGLLCAALFLVLVPAHATIRYQV